MQPSSVRASIAITLKQIHTEKSKELFDDLISRLKKHTDQKQLDSNWEVSVLSTNTSSLVRDGNNVVTEKKAITELSAVTNIFKTKKPVVSLEDLQDNLAVVASWVEASFKPNQTPSVEVTSNIFKFPLFFKNKSYKPSQTWYDLKLIPNEEKDKIVNFNKAVRERKK